MDTVLRGVDSALQMEVLDLLRESQSKLLDLPWEELAVPIGEQRDTHTYAGRARAKSSLGDSG